jgi:uncharacterized membrane protein
MNKSEQNIQQYLDELKIALKGQPAGLVQDALYDTENHLVEAITCNESTSLSEVISAFGSPQEIAAQYVQMEEDATRFLNGDEANKPLFNGFFEPLSSFKDYKSLCYFFVSLPISIIYFALAMLLGAPALVLSLMIVGLPLLALFLKFQSYIALVEGQLINTFLGIRMPRRPSRSNSIAFSGSSLLGAWRKVWNSVTLVHHWRVVLYSVLHLPLSATYFFAVCIVFAGSLALVMTPIIDPLIHLFWPHLAIDINWYWLPVTSIVGAIGVTLSMHISRLLVNLHSSIASYLLIQR